MSTEAIFSSDNIIIETFTPKIGNKTIQKNDLRDYSDDAQNKSWRYLPQSAGLHSTQQVKVDWTNFAQHTFFSSAEVKVNSAFQRVINHFPFDGNQIEKQVFYDSMNGYEEYVYDIFPKYIGHLNFNGTNNKITVSDSQGYLYPQLARSSSLQSIVGSGVRTNGGYTFESYIYVPDDNTARDNQILFQKLSTDGMTGITIAVSASLGTDDNVMLHSIFTSGSGEPSSTRNAYTLHVSASMPKGKFTHFATSYDRDDTSTLNAIVDGKFIMSSSQTLYFDELDFLRSDITIGAGTDHVRKIASNSVDAIEFHAGAFFTGSLDELRFWTSAKTTNEISASMNHPALKYDNLALYYKFNEPTGSYGNLDLVLDSSGNGLHARIENYATTNRIKDYNDPVVFESTYDNPVLFPDHSSVTSLNIKLLSTASNYDIINPNMILKLVPEHYLREDDVQPVDASLIPEFTSSLSIPGGGKLPSSQVIANFLYVWAAFFDDIKLYIDTMSDIAALNHQDIDGIPQNAIEMVARQYGFELPNLFFDSTPEQFHLGRNFNENVVHSDRSLKSILNSIWRRVTAEIPHITRSKGTLSSIKQLLNSFGVDADSNFRIREFGTHPNYPNIATMRRNRVKNTSAVNFDANTPYMFSNNLTAYRWEPGFPGTNFSLPVFNAGTGVFSNHPREISLTSGSWTAETHFIMNQQTSATTQSLLRLDMSGSDTKTAPFLNVLAYSGSFYTPEDYKVRMVVAASGSDGSNHPASLDLELPRVNLFDGARWYLNVSKKIDNGKSEMIIRLRQANNDRIYASYTTSSFITDVAAHPFKAYQRADNIAEDAAIAKNPKPFLSFGKYDGYASNYLNNTVNKTAGFATTDFFGQHFNIRFWSKSLTTNETNDHALNPFSFGSSDPIINSPYSHPYYPALGVTGSDDFIPTGLNKDGMLSTNSGSWERLRMFVDHIDGATNTDAKGTMTLQDLSQNGYNLNIVNAAASSKIIDVVRCNYSYFDPNWDTPSVSNKIRPRSFLDKETADIYDAVHGSLTELDPREKITDDRRFSIEASIAQTLNEDISNTISDIFFLENSIGAPELLYAINYPDLQKLAEKYFERLEDKVDFANYFAFFKWFNTNFATLLEKMVPNTTEFLGVNFVIESHMLERHKLQYQQADVHIDLSRRLAATVDRFTNANVSVTN